jgi:GR25 family glycosyltransferase involved in LPS biosynthesis
MQHIDAILYINLAYRTDRNEHILMEIAKLCNNSSKIHRIDAIKHDKGAIGCGQSHIKALQYAQSHPEWNSVLILEDDFTFLPDKNYNEMINVLFQTCPQFDVGLPSYNHNELKYTNTEHDSIKKVSYSQTTSSYIIKQHYIPKLIANLSEAVDSMQHRGVMHENSIDIYWNNLIKAGNWFCIYPAIGYQYNNYSDIQNGITNYGC